MKLLRPIFPLLLGSLISLQADAQSAANPARGVDWLSFQTGIHEAEASSRKLIVDVYAPWCGWCSRLQAEVYTNSKVQKYLARHFKVARLNIDVMDDVIRFKGYKLSSGELAMGLGATGTPTTVFLDSGGDYITRLPGFVGPDEFLNILRFIATDNYKKMSYEDFVASL